MKIRLSMFVLPQEIDAYEGIVKQLKVNSTLIEELEVEMDVTLSLSDQLMNWNECKLPKSYFEDKFVALTRFFDWANPASRFDVSEDDWVLGCVSKRRQSWQDMSDDTIAMTVLDCDIVFPMHTLYYIEQSIKHLQGLDYWALTPEIIRIWDGTWDELVNENYMDRDNFFHKTADVYTIVNDPYLMEKGGELRTLNNAKFSGGWMTTISKKLLDLTTIPQEFGHYGLEDTYVMACMNQMKRAGITADQYVMEGLIVCENYLYRDDEYLTKYLSNIDRRKEYLSVAEAAFGSAVAEFGRSKIHGAKK